MKAVKTLPTLSGRHDDETPRRRKQRAKEEQRIVRRRKEVAQTSLEERNSGSRKDVCGPARPRQPEREEDGDERVPQDDGGQQAEVHESNFRRRRNVHRRRDGRGSPGGHLLRWRSRDRGQHRSDFAAGTFGQGT